jgi:hypothetical protein
VFYGQNNKKNNKVLLRLLQNPLTMTEHVLSKLELWDSPSTSKFDHLLHCIQQNDLLKNIIMPVVEHVVSNFPSKIPSHIPHIEQHVFDILKSFKHYKFEKTPSPDGAADSLTVTYSFEGDNSTESIIGHYKCCFEEVDSLESFQSGQIWTHVFQVKLEGSNKIYKLIMKDTAAHGNIKDKAKTGTEYVLTETDLPTPMESK